ncbi:MAG: hypothetical protein PHQ19_00345 [Candidatus Krumholzibacteria bacterium]|nr:hypothetical protein [Candidatus Krumholzibacteria bacterium]
MDGPKQRHGCLTAWLILMIVANSLSALVYLFAKNLIMDAAPGAPGWTFPVYAALGIVNVVCAVALARWKKWGFYGFVVTTVAGMVSTSPSGRISCRSSSGSPASSSSSASSRSAGRTRGGRSSNRRTEKEKRMRRIVSLVLMASGLLMIVVLKRSYAHPIEMIRATGAERVAEVNR